MGRQYVDVDDGVDSLDAAWEDAEAALPDEWEVWKVELDPVAWWAFARSFRGGHEFDAHGDTPAAALRALAKQLRQLQELRRR